MPEGKLARRTKNGFHSKKGAKKGGVSGVTCLIVSQAAPVQPAAQLLQFSPVQLLYIIEFSGKLYIVTSHTASSSSRGQRWVAQPGSSICGSKREPVQRKRLCPRHLQLYARRFALVAFFASPAPNAFFTRIAAKVTIADAAVRINGRSARQQSR